MVLPKHNFLIRLIYLLGIPVMFLFLAWDGGLLEGGPLESEWLNYWFSTLLSVTE